MNTQNILKVADAIEKHTIADLGFNMGRFRGPVTSGLKDLSGRNCGTVACIAGWTRAILPDDDRSSEEILEISEEQADELFAPTGWSTRPERFPQDQAIRTLRHLAATGEVDWTVA